MATYLGLRDCGAHTPCRSEIDTHTVPRAPFPRMWTSSGPCPENELLRRPYAHTESCCCLRCTACTQPFQRRPCTGSSEDPPQTSDSSRRRHVTGSLMVQWFSFSLGIRSQSGSAGEHRSPSCAEQCSQTAATMTIRQGSFFIATFSSGENSR